MYVGAGAAHPVTATTGIVQVASLKSWPPAITNVAGGRHRVVPSDATAGEQGSLRMLSNQPAKLDTE
jgi:hypothetical protein